jgi:ABC-type transport system substrate-binding protein
MRSIRAVELLLALLLLGCPDLPAAPRYRGAGHEQPVRGGTLMLSEEPRVRMLDPHVAFDQISSVLIDMLYDKLYAYDHALRMQPRLATALPTISEDGLTLTVPIRRGVQFHNGRKLDAYEVIWSLERMLSPALQSPGAQYFGSVRGADAYQAGKAPHVSGLSAPDAYTLRIELTRPDQTFVYALAMRFAAPMAREAVQGDPKRQPIGTGQFRLISWDPGVRLVLERFEKYDQAGKPYLDRIVFEESVKRDTAFLRFRNGEVDVAQRIAPADVMMLNAPAWRPYRAIGARADTYGLVMNTQMKPFDDVHLRRAVSYAIDRERWAVARNRTLHATGQIIPPNIGGYDEALPHKQTFDLQKAREELKLAGYPQGLPEVITCWSTENSASRAYFELAESDLSKIGIKLRLKTASFPVWLEETGKPHTAAMTFAGWSLDFPDASNMFNLFSKVSIAEHDSMNRAFFSDPWVEEALERSRVERDPDQRIAQYRAINDKLAELAPWAFFANTQVPQAWQPYVKGYRPHPIEWMDVSEVWLDLPRKRVASVQRTRARMAGMLPGFVWGGAP